MANAILGNYAFRINPSDIHWDYKINATRIDTLGGQVVQVLGATLGDMTVTGYFGQDYKNNIQSWQLAESFATQIRTMMDQQVLPQSAVSLQSDGKGNVVINNQVHQPWTFVYQDGTHDWNYRVLIKKYEDLDGGQMRHSTGKFSYGYRLTLFIVEADTDILTQVAKDDFISKVSTGLGWKQSEYNGNISSADFQKFMAGIGNDPTAYLSGLLTTVKGGSK